MVEIFIQCHVSKIHFDPRICLYVDMAIHIQLLVLFHPHTDFRFDEPYCCTGRISVGFGALSEEIVGGGASSCEECAWFK